jgi:hypothetical protein
MLVFEPYELLIGTLLCGAGITAYMKLPPASAGHDGGPLDARDFAFGGMVVLVAAAAYYFGNVYNSPYDYTFRIAKAILRGQLGLDYTPPSAFSEFVPLNGWYYSVFPLGSVVVMLPVALVTKVFPAKIIVAALGAFQTLAAYLIARAYRMRTPIAAIYAGFLAFGTWHLCNLCFGGAWQIAIGFAVTAMLWAIYFTLIVPRPFWAGVFFAIAFGNRTELLLVAPFFYYCFYRPVIWRRQFHDFSAIPFILGVLTLLYNYKRFGSPLDFGYARIPGVLDEPWYKGGIFNVNSVILNLRQMLLVGWKSIDSFPYLTPTGFGGSIFLASPFLLTIFRRGHKNTPIFVWSWVLCAALIAVLWLHGNPGGWQYSYRYAGILLPWIYLLIMERSPTIFGLFEKCLIPISVFISFYATYLFYWTNYVQP